MPYAGFLIPGNKILPAIAFINLFTVVGVPATALLFRGIRFLSGRKLLTPNIKAGLWSFWSVNLLAMFAIASFTARHFTSGEQESSTIAIDVPFGDTLTIQSFDNLNSNSIIEIGNVDLEDNKLYNYSVDLTIARSKDQKFELETKISSRGQDSEEASLLANEVKYNVSLVNGVLTIPRGFIIEKGSKYRGQTVDLVLRVPDGVPLTIGKEVRRILSNVDVQEHRITPWSHLGKSWKMGRDGLVCLECPESKVGDETYSFKDFNQLQIEGKMKVTINKSDAYRVHLTGKEVYTRKVEMVQTKDKLMVNAALSNPRSPVRLYIDMPTLGSLDFENTDDIKISGFVQPNMEIKGDSKYDLKAYIDVDSLKLNLKEKTEFDIRGSGKYLKANLHGRAKLDSEHYTVNVADIRTENYSRASVAVVDTLRKSRLGDSRINADGEPKVVIDSQQ